MNSLLDAYASSGHKKVRGWLNDIAIQILLRLAEGQEEQGINGSVCEIGVHHGKLLILLHLLTTANERSVGWDLFDRQGENTDQSGRGDRRILLENFERHHCDVSRVRAITANSLEITDDQVLTACGGRPRIFSIDGGHTAELTLNDLRLAARTLCDGGLVLIDDFFNEAWPGVAEGVCRYMAAENTNLIPVVIGGNKYAFTNNADIARAYQSRLSHMGDRLQMKRSQAFGSAVIVVLAPEHALKAYLRKTAIWKLIGNTRLGGFIRSRFT